MIIFRKVFSEYDPLYKRTHSEFGDYNHSMIIGQKGRDTYRNILLNPNDKKLQELIREYEDLDGGDYPMYYRDIKNRVAAADYYDGLISQKEYRNKRLENQKEHKKKTNKKEQIIFK